VKRRHDKPLTPCERLLPIQNVSAESKKWLRGESACLNTLERIASWSTV
jgi:hypothetical protein